MKKCLRCYLIALFIFISLLSQLKVFARLHISVHNCLKKNKKKFKNSDLYNVMLFMKLNMCIQTHAHTHTHTIELQ